MGIKMKSILLTCLVFLIFSCTDKKDLCYQERYTFTNNTLQYYPAKKQYNLGDTIWVKINLPIIQTDTKTNTEINFIADSINCRFGFMQLSETTNQFQGALDKFQIAIISGENSFANSFGPNRLKTFKLQKSNEDWLLHFALVPVKKGKYFIGTGDIGGFSSVMCNSVSDYITYANQSQDNNMDLFEQWIGRTPHYLDIQYNYCFEVI